MQQKGPQQVPGDLHFPRGDLPGGHQAPFSATIGGEIGPGTLIERRDSLRGITGTADQPEGDPQTRTRLNLRIALAAMIPAR